MRKIISMTLLAIVNLFFMISPVLAETIVPTLLSSTEASVEDPNSLPPFPAELSLEKISFKDSTADHFTFRLTARDRIVNLRGLEFYDDRVFKTINEDFFVESGQEIIFRFNSPSEQDQDSSQSPDGAARLFSAQNGLTGTSEQLLIRRAGKALSFFCWYKTPIASAELQEFPQIVPLDIWEDGNQENCFPSSGVKNNQVLIKIGDENNAEAWEIELPAESTSPKGKTGDSTPQISLEELIESGGQSGSWEEGDIVVSEIFPAPTTKQESEWIELVNSSDRPLNLENWIIDDGEKGSKPRRLSSITVTPETPLLIDLRELKITLNNDSDSIRLFLPDGTPVVEQRYDGAKKGNSFALISKDGEESWQWTGTPTPGLPNPELQTVHGTIDGEPVFGPVYHFPLSPAPAASIPENNAGKILVIFTEETLKAPLAREIFRPGQSGDFRGELSPAPPNAQGYSQILKLHGYELGGTAAAPFWQTGLMTVLCAAALAGGGALLWPRKQLSAPPNYSTLPDEITSQTK
jgi:hypothetical protein